ncbi:Gfo/Idh/MocA family oxidoreductase [Oscillatoria sp. CS-180]|uniref:Gfo/Idh/MocA family protein n=1 Tax=Oscillatoria sp. CS-180 TaxID=3021720 RepID=UPI00232AD12F|nr:Gfo/Idh/MocA family oxidoreductase [Oscillatoria sp. CS-180]MDB9526944.1 Gfo/Idh/MocA family oxidoreductase [Oscillatoria sp. CS-180]
MAESAIGVALVGTGFGQKVHIPGFQAHHRTQLVAVYHREIAKAQAIAEQHAITHACDTIDQIVALPEVDAVSIATPPFLRSSVAIAALEANKHILLEKPTALSVEEAQQIEALAQQQKKIAVVDFEFRFVPAWQHFATLLAEEFVGTPRLIKVDWMVAGRADPARAWSWYARKDQGGGALGAFASHTFDYLAWLFGPVKRLCANLTTAISERPDPTTGQLKPVDADDTCTLMLEMASGMPCQVTISSVTYAGRGHWVEVYGDRGTLILGSDNLKDYVHGFKLWGAQGSNSLEEIAVPDAIAFPKTYDDGRIAPFVRVVDHWVNCIDQGEPKAPSITEGVYSQLLMDLAHESNNRGSWVENSRDSDLRT